jgi:thioredoxin-like negative regulator of GroEL
MITTIRSIEEFEKFVAGNRAMLAYFSTNECNVCKVLKPKVEVLFEREFPKFRLCYVEINHLPELAAQNRIFIAPTIVIYFEGKEFVRKSRNFGISELREEVNRPYSILFL